MLGRSTASLHPAPLKWIARRWGVADIHARQKWTAVWPILAALPRDGVRLLDAGCGYGAWTLEIAARRPGWSVTGIDRQDESIRQAEWKRSRLGLANAAFFTADFLRYRPARPFDVVLSVASAHYLVRAGMGEELFSCFREWLGPAGMLLLYGPRDCRERPLLPFLKSVGGGWGYSADELQDLCRRAGLHVRWLRPEVEAFGAAAKQISAAFGVRPAGRVATYPLQIALSAIGKFRRPRRTRSIAYLLAAGRARGEATRLPRPAAVAQAPTP